MKAQDNDSSKTTSAEVVKNWSVAKGPVYNRLAVSLFKSFTTAIKTSALGPLSERY